LAQPAMRRLDETAGTEFCSGRGDRQGTQRSHSAARRVPGGPGGQFCCILELAMADAAKERSNRFRTTPNCSRCCAFACAVSGPARFWRTGLRSAFGLFLAAG